MIKHDVFLALAQCQLVFDSTFGADSFCPHVLYRERSAGQILTKFHVNIMPLEATLYTEHFHIQGVSVNRAIWQHCFFWFGNTGVDAAITILLPTLTLCRP